MRFLRLLSVLPFFISLPVMAQAWKTPERGTQIRADLMDALRPHAEQIYGAPVVFVVQDLRVAGDAAFGMLLPVRPDGTPIDATDLRPAYGDAEDAEFWGGPDMQVLYRKSGQTWVAVHHAYGATDVWRADTMFCHEWHAVIPEYCAN